MNNQNDLNHIDLFIRLNQNLLEVKDTSGVDVFAVKEKIDKLLDKRLELMKKKETVVKEEEITTTNGEDVIDKVEDEEE